MNRWTVFNILSIIAGMLAAGIWTGIIFALVQAPGWANIVVGFLLGRVTTRLIHDQIR